MRIDGGCHCGFIKYEAEVDPEKVIICHCTDCQALSGTAFRTVVFVEEDKFNLLSGDLKTYIKTADSGRKRTQMFCPECGTQIYSAPVGGTSRTIGVRVGTARQRAELRPKKQYWCGSALDWVEELSSMERVS
jgi:hypothetical protein